MSTFKTVILGAHSSNKVISVYNNEKFQSYFYQDFLGEEYDSILFEFESVFYSKKTKLSNVRSVKNVMYFDIVSLFDAPSVSKQVLQDLIENHDFVNGLCHTIEISDGDYIFLDSFQDKKIILE